MLGLLRQPLVKSVKIAQFGVKNVAQPIPRVLQRSYGWSNHVNHGVPIHHEKTQWVKKTCMYGGALVAFVLVNWAMHDFTYFAVKQIQSNYLNKKKCCGCCNQCN